MWADMALIGVVALWFVSAALSVPFPGSIGACPSPEDRQFVVSVPTHEPLGLRLSAKLKILEFIPDAQGRSRAVEASGLAEIGDQLLSVNDVALTGLTFEDALLEIGRAVVPKQLRLQTRGGRCSGLSVSHATKSGEGSFRDDSRDVLVVSLGTKGSDRSFYAVPSAAGRPPGCVFREVVVSNPPHACSPLIMNATDRYVVVPHITGCPIHQKVAFVQEAGAAAGIFVQREGEKPQQIKVPRELPTPIFIPLVMVSFDSGWQIIDMVTAKALPSNSAQIRFVFSEECKSEKYSIHPGDDPLLRSVVNRIESAGAGFMSVTVAESGSTTLEVAAFEFLRPQPIDPAHGVVPLPLGRQPLFLKTSSLTLNACDLRPEKQPSELLYWASEIESSFVVARLRDSECSVAAQVAFFSEKKAAGVVFLDLSFPVSASSQPTRQAAEQSTIPFVIVSFNSFETMFKYRDDNQANHILVEFAGENALQHQWADLRLLQDVDKWPRSERARERLFYRMLKDQGTPRDEAVDAKLLVKRERRDSLELSFQRVQRFYQQG